MDLPPPTWLRSFEAAARHGGFTAAADELNLTPAAVSQHIRLLEQHLNVALFDRQARGVVLTDRGQAYAQPVRKGFAELQAATSGLFGASRREQVRVRASISCAALVIAPRLGHFYTLHPDIDVELTTFVWADRFSDDDHHVDIRFGYGDWSDGVVLALGPEEGVPVCRPDYAARFETGLSLQALAAGPRVTIHGSETDWPRLLEQSGVDPAAPAREMRVDSSLLALQTVSAGPGAVIVLESFARQFLEHGQLVAPLSERLDIRPSHFLVTREGAEARPGVRAFSAWVQSIYNVDAALSPGAALRSNGDA